MNNPLSPSISELGDKPKRQVNDLGAAEGRIILSATNEFFRLSCSDDCLDVVKERGVVPCHDEEYGYGEHNILAEILMFHR